MKTLKAFTYKVYWSSSRIVIENKQLWYRKHIPFDPVELEPYAVSKVLKEDFWKHYEPCKVSWLQTIVLY